MDARIAIRDSIVEIGDKSQGEKVIEIRGPIFVSSSEHKLILYCKECTDQKAHTALFPVQFLNFNSSEEREKRTIHLEAIAI